MIMRYSRGEVQVPAAWLVLLLAGCAAAPPAAIATRGANPPAAERIDHAAQERATTSTSVRPAQPARADTPAPRSEAERQAFSTRYAHFLPASWTELPGWRQDRLAEAWSAFGRSCAALGRKPAWDGPCERAAAITTASDEAIRQFFEREFALYEIRNTDRSPEGIITGYYEPLINGSRSEGGAFVYPVYGVPDDLLMLDIRQIPQELRGKRVPARIEGRSVIAVPGGDAPYLIDVGDLRADVRDKKLRVRLEGERIVPYATRAEIERDGLPNARVLVWVDNPAAFYSMQIQGSGKVRLPDGKIVRLSYGEQNGHPFTPPAGKGNRGGKKGRVTTRGLSIDLPDVEDEMAGADQNAGQPLTRGGRAAPALRPVPRADEPSAADVERLVEQLATGKPATIGPRRPPARVAAAGGVPASAVARFPQPSAALVNAISADPSYVFFREIPDGPEGPIGALGVSLTAGRSVAVDPRTTPLGYPVFMSTGQPGQTDSLNRLVMAQDTGGAIRGAVRADYFWGFGAAAYEQAANMKESGRMWLMLPHGQQVAARDQALRTRGAAGGRSDLECVIADPDLCVEDR